MSCDHKFVDSNVCLKCGVSIGQLRAENRSELEAYENAPRVLNPEAIGNPNMTPIVQLPGRLDRAAVTRERAQELAEKSILAIAHNLDEIQPKDYDAAFAQLRTFIAHVTDDVEKNKLDTGSVMLLGAACITLLREAVVRWPEQVTGAKMPTRLPEGS